MTSLIDWFIGLSWLINIILDVGAAYYAYKLTKVTGGFRAWWLIIGFTILFVVTSFTSVSYGILASAAQGTSTTTAGDLVSGAYLNVLLNLLMSVLLFTAMFELHRTFKRIQTTQADRRQ